MKNFNQLKPLILLELNEVNFDVVDRYISDFPGKFKGLELLLSQTRTQTIAEENYSELEPWIQWVSVYSGMSYSEHSIYRLGDIVGSGVKQIFEAIENFGFKVGCISPMNAENRLNNPAYFIPDPWTKSLSDGSFWSKHLARAISQAVNDNSQSKLSIKSVFFIALGLVRFAKFKHYFLYFRLIIGSIGSSWRKALILDLFLHDLHTCFFNDKQPQFSTLFLNAGAHIQHHYFHNSPLISAETGFRNPSWYVSPNLDPFSEMLEVYDRIIEEYLTNDDYELIVATGLSQCPYDRIKYYYRLKDHAGFLRKIGINFLEIYPRMTRDFLVTFKSIDDAKNAQNILSELRITEKSEPLFGEIENRGDNLFVTLTYPNELLATDILRHGSIKLEILQEVAFVAIKNGMHQSKGFAFFTPDIAKLCPPNDSHVKELYSTIINYFK